MEKMKKKNITDNSHNNVVTTPRQRKETPFSAGDRVKQIKNVQQSRKAILDELDKS
jgi:hypothetical protein